MTNVIPTRPIPSIEENKVRFQKTPLGDFTLGEILFFYDTELVFFVFDPAGDVWLANALNDNVKARTSDWALSKLLPGDKEVLEIGHPNRVDTINAITKRSSYLLRESWDTYECIDMHLMTAEEIATAYGDRTVTV